jgi:hypothetical protein
MSNLPAGYDFLGKLGNDLRDLTGLDTLIYELVQNADDASRATRMRFETSGAGLVIWNDGTFTDCGRQELRDCPGVPGDDGLLVRCDFHSIRQISGHAKREKKGTTGAFGIGFTAVFQITDYPELISCGRHWRLRYDEPEANRIDVCDGCEHDHDAPGTTFVLPWARDENSRVRTGLRFGPVDANIEERFLEEATRAIAPAAVFLRRLRRIEITDPSSTRAIVARVDETPVRLLKTDTGEHRLMVLKGEFDIEAEALRARHPSVLGVDVREAEVYLAIPFAAPEERLALHAVLPTRETTALGLRLSSSFYPFQDRKRLKFAQDGDPESDWNRAAVAAGARRLAEALPGLPDILGAERLWSLLRSLHDVAAAIDDAPDPAFARFWTEMRDALAGAAAVRTAGGQWATPKEVLIIRPEWRPALDALHEVGLGIVAHEIHDDVAALASEIGIRWLGAAKLSGAIKKAGLGTTRPRASLPGCLAKREGLDALLRLVADLTGSVPADEERVRSFDGCAIVPCLEESVGAPDEISLEAADVVDLFRHLPGLRFVDAAEIDRIDDRLRFLLRPLKAGELADALGEVGDLVAPEGVTSIPWGRQVLRWLSNHADAFEPKHIAVLREAAIVPTTRGLRPLSALELPGAFTTDPLDITETVDLAEIEGLRYFLGEGCLGAQDLDLDVYVQERLVPAFEEGETFTDAQLDRLLAVLADNGDDLNVGLLKALAALPLIPTCGGTRLPAERAYFDTPEVRTILGSDAVVQLDERSLRKLLSLLTELGVARVPRPADIVASVVTTVEKAKTDDAIARIRTIVEHLGARVRFGTDAQRDERRGELAADYGPLLDLGWLPATGGGWARPEELHRTDWRSAFRRTGNFIELPEAVQQRNANLLELLGVGLRPEASLVIDHLLACVADGEAVSKRVYQRLDEVDSDALAPLVGRPCILVSADPVRYVTPADVVRDPGPLRGYLHPLPSEIAGYHNLVEALGIEPGPTAESAITVLGEIADKVRDGAVDESELAAVQFCWRLLGDAIDDHRAMGEEEKAGEWCERIAVGLGELRCWPDRRNTLRRPDRLFIDDLPALRQYVDDEVIVMLIDRPRAGLVALETAGLRFLSDAITEEILEAPNPREDDDLRTELRARRDALARVLSDADLGLEGLDKLSQLRLLAVDRILVLRSIDDPPLGLGEHPLPVFVDRNTETLRHVGPWRSNALSLAVAITPLLCGSERYTSGVAGNIEKVLSAASSIAAHEALDLLHIPRLGHEAEHHVAADEDESLFAEEDDVVDSTSESGEDAAEAADVSGVTRQDVGEVEEDDGDKAADAYDESTARSSVDDDDDQETRMVGADEWPMDGAGVGSGSSSGGGDGSRSDGTRAAGDGERSRSPAGNGPSPGWGGQAGSAAARGRGATSSPAEIPWRVWVSGGHGARQDEVEHGQQTSELRRKVDVAAIARVKQYETDHGREPREMAQNHEGYDIESANGPGRPVLRRIEVKGLSGLWEAEFGTAGRPPQLSRSQYRESQTEGRHWLYVVEHALDDDAFAIYPIQTVGQRANRYLLDHGWKEAADRPTGPGIVAPERVDVGPALPDASSVLFGREDREPGDVPYLGWAELAVALESSELAATAERWFTSPAEASEGDFAVQQPDGAMGPALPFGAIAVFRPADGQNLEGAIVLADVSPEHTDPTYAIRRAHLITNQDDSLERLLLTADIHGRGEEHEFTGQYALARVLAVLVGHQPL